MVSKACSKHRQHRSPLHASGLVPDYQCFDKCSSAWSFYINDNLRKLITTGKGEPQPGRRLIGIFS